MKRILIIGLIGILCIVLLVIIACVRPILPGSLVEIVYPAPDATVPTEFSVLAVGTRWSVGVEVETLLFLGAPKSYVNLSPSPAELTLDGVLYAKSNGGNHHVFRIQTTPGDHTLGLMTPYGKKEITVHVTDIPPVTFAPFDRADEYAGLVDDLMQALYNYTQNAPPVFPDDAGTIRYQKIFLTDNGAFIFFGQMRDRFMDKCQLRYLDTRGRTPTADDITGAPVVFSWDQAGWGRPVKLATVESGGDRLYCAIIDTERLTAFSIFPDGTVGHEEFSLSEIAPGFAESVATAFSTDIKTKALRGVLFIVLDAYQMNGTPGRFNLLVSGGTVKALDLNYKEVDGITPTGDLITLYPASFVGPFDSALVSDTGKTSACFPLPQTGDTFSFMGGTIHSTDLFYPEHPRFEIGPPVPCIGCTKDYFPPHRNVAREVTFGPEVFRVTLGGKEEYFIMEAGEK